MNKVLITGATGFIGKHFIDYLLRKQYAVRILARKKDSQQSIETHIGDITQPKSLIGACDGVDTVFHLAGFAHAIENKAHAESHHQINYLGTQHLFKEAKRARVNRFIYVSSVKASDAITIGDQSPYARAKLAAENYLLADHAASAYTPNGAMHITILRPALVYGRGWKGHLAAMLRAIDRNRFPPLPETNNRRSMVSANDLCQAAELASLSPRANGKIYTVTDGHHYSTRQIYDLMCHALSKKPPRFYIPLMVFRMLAYLGNGLTAMTRKRMPFNGETYQKLFGNAEYSSKLLQEELGFRAKDHLENVLPAIVADYRAKQ